MESTFLYNIQDAVIWDWRVATDLFVGGIGVGAFLFSFVLWRFGGEAYRGLARTASIITPIMVSLGLLLLFWKLGNRWIAYQMMLNVSPASMMWWGASVQGVFVALAALFAWRLFFPDSGLLAFIKTAWVGWIGAVLAVLIGLYHGLLIATIGTYPVWASAGLIMASLALFLATGPAAAFLIHRIVGSNREAKNMNQSDLLRPLGFLLAGASILVLAALAAWWFDLTFGSVRDQDALAAVMNAYGAVLLLAIVFGLLLPIVLLLRASMKSRDGNETVSPTLVTACCVLILAAGFTIRYAAVLGGQIDLPDAHYAVMEPVR